MLLNLMEGKGTSFVLRVTLLCLTYFGSHAQIQDGPKDLTVLTGSNASFLCTVTRGWASITWTVNNLYVVGVSPAAGSIVEDPNIIVRNSTNQVNLAFTSEITILSVDRTRSGKVQCSLLSYGFQEATLTVQVNGSLEITNGSITTRPNIPVYLSCRFLNWFPEPEITWRINETTANRLSYTTDYVFGNDQMVNGASLLNITAEYKTTVTCLANIETLVSPQSTSVDVTVSDNISGGSLDQTTIIIIAVCVSVGCLLIIIIIVVTVLCCCKKKERDTSYQSDAWKVSSIKSDYLQTSQNGRAGEHNLSYTPEPSRISYAESNNSIFTVTPMRHTVEQAPEYQKTDRNPTTVRHLTHV